MWNTAYDQELQMQLTQLLESIAERWSVEEIRKILVEIEAKKTGTQNFTNFSFSVH